ncbi:MAG: hypothetical protein M3Q40_00400 [Pseudomonadota bacterium]|nr:hypothetical protein [Pseudomonadota bacterium]
MCVLGSLSCVAVAASDLPASLKWTLALCALAWAGACVRSGLAHPPRTLVLAGGAGRCTVDEEEVSGLRVCWRGPLVFVHWRDVGRSRRSLVWWPDTLTAAERRELRLAAPLDARAREPGSVAT